MIELFIFKGFDSKQRIYRNVPKGYAKQQTLYF